MCWSAEASAAMVAAGVVATGIALSRKEPPAIPLTLGYFTVMEGLQLAGYGVLDQCGTTANQAVTLLSYLHIVFQPLVINLFAMELVPAPIRARARRWVIMLSLAAGAVMLAQLLPVPAFGKCLPGTPLCAEALCTVSGSWHIAWNIPYNGLMVPLERALGFGSGFPTYMLAVFVLPLVYGAWRFVLLHAVTGPFLAWTLTDNPNEMPAVWCLFSIAILVVSLSIRARGSVTARTWWGMRVTSG
ncbi:DUF5765 domain-containing protein [Marimonas sp. MJW-29]|uniref:DUF5765 domain-containing protein n=1 Tax=Sulfitobacter sediminis TaxID=3234186 RepID=A0ABV3RRL7_9RHOB